MLTQQGTLGSTGGSGGLAFVAHESLTYDNAAVADSVLIDLDGDLKLDLAIARAENLQLAFGRGDASFSRGGLLALGFPARGLEAHRVVAGDVDRDGDNDLVVGLTDSDTYDEVICLLRGRGDGTFNAPELIQRGELELQGIADVNVDGKLDIWSTGYDAVADATGSISVLPGRGDGTFLPQVLSTIRRREPLTHPQLADLNGDGLPDLMTGSYYPGIRNSSDVTLVLGRGDGTFSGTTVLADNVGGDPHLLDLDGDGKLDLVEVFSTSLKSRLGHGDGTFGPQTTLTTTFAEPYVAAGDIDGDGIADLVTAGSGQTLLRIGLGLGQFASASAVVGFPRADAFGPGGLVLADLDGDGDLDAVRTGYDVTPLVNVGDRFMEPVRIATGLISLGLGALDLNGDGRLDLITGDQSVSSFTFVLNLPDGGWLPTRGHDGGGGAGALVVADIDGDGRPEVTSVVGTRLTVNQIGTDLRIASTTWTLPANPGAGGIRTGDVNGDGRPDFLVGGPQYFVTALGLVDGGVAPLPSFDAGFASSDWALGDLDGDGQDELVNLRSTTVLAASRFGSDGGFRPLFASTYVRDSRLSALALGDFDGDGHLDAAVVDDAREQVAFFQGFGDGGFGPEQLSPTLFLNSSSRAVAAELDGDGLLDLVIDDGLGRIRTMRGDGHGLFALPQGWMADSSSSLTLMARDLDGDGRVDLAATRYITNGRPGTNDTLTILRGR